MYLGPHLGPPRHPELSTVPQKILKTHFFQDFGSEGPQMGPQIFFSKGNYYDTSFLIHVWGPIWGPSTLWPEKIHFFQLFWWSKALVQIKIEMSGAPFGTPKYYSLQVWHLSFHCKCIFILDRILDVLKRAKPKNAIFCWFWIKMRPQNCKCPSTFFKKMHRALSKMIWKLLRVRLH